MRTRLLKAHTDMMLRKDDGATAIEYALIVTLIALAIIVAVTAVGDQLSTVFDNVKTALGG